MATLVLLESHPRYLQLMVAVALVTGIIGFAPLANAVSYLLVGKELKEIDRFCTRLKEGDYGCAFELPHEKDDENELIILKRNLNWMAHVISHRESWLHAALEGAHEDRNHYELLSNLDPLTGLANRRCFEQRLTQLAQESEVTKRSLSLMFIDCDKFKSVNDNLGHQAGDLLLKKLAEIIRGQVRQHMDLPFRFGGDEFGVICVGMTPAQAAEAAERIRTQFMTQPTGDTTLSIGVAGYVSQGCAASCRQCAASSGGGGSGHLPGQGQGRQPGAGGRGVAVMITKFSGPRTAEWLSDLANNPFDRASEEEETPGSPRHHRYGDLHEFAESLGNAIDAKDHYTRLHSEQVANLAHAIAQQMSLPARLSEAIHIAGHLHDIGKIGVPDYILQKTTPLTDQEWELVRQHPRIGAQIVTPVQALNGASGIAKMILHHHERWDGRGYPHGLAGLQIPLGARILAVADALSAMIQDRPYRTGMSFPAATAELRRVAGSQPGPPGGGALPAYPVGTQQGGSLALLPGRFVMPKAARHHAWRGAS